MIETLCTDRLPCQGALLAWLVATLGVARAVEVGVFTGYSALSVALVWPQLATILFYDDSPFFVVILVWFYLTLKPHSFVVTLPHPKTLP